MDTLQAVPSAALSAHLLLDDEAAAASLGGHRKARPGPSGLTPRDPLHWLVGPGAQSLQRSSRSAGVPRRRRPAAADDALRAAMRSARPQGCHREPGAPRANRPAVPDQQVETAAAPPQVCLLYTSDAAD